MSSEEDAERIEQLDKYVEQLQLMLLRGYDLAREWPQFNAWCIDTRKLIGLLEDPRRQEPSQ